MPKTLNQEVTDFQTLANDTSNGTLARTLINIGVRKILGMQDWTFNKDKRYYSSGTHIQDYEPPYNSAKIEYVNYWYKNVWYTPREVRNGGDWVRLNNVIQYSSFPSHWYISNRSKKIRLFPIPSDSLGTIKVGFTKKMRDLSVADYSTGTIKSVANGSTVFTGDSTSWGTVMQGRSISVSGTNTPADGFWFEIDTISTGSILTTKELAPNDISNAPYTISEMIPLPDGFEDLPTWYALAQYYHMKEKTALAQEYERSFETGVEELVRRDSRSAVGLIEKQGKIEPQDPNSNPWALYIQ